jgi:hypothetical protein
MMVDVGLKAGPVNIGAAHLFPRALLQKSSDNIEVNEAKGKGNRDHVSTLAGCQERPLTLLSSSVP